jgi:uncharacterized repeat protein (TIGR03803 family)
MVNMRIAPVLSGLLLFGLTAHPAPGQTDTEAILHRFIDGNDGEVPEGVVFDKHGNLYGTTQMGGSGPCTLSGQGCGEVFEATPARDASGHLTWEKRVIYEFQGGDDDGATPMAPLVLDEQGNLYGTTTAGGGTEYGAGCGTVFELHTEGGEWIEKVLYKFTCGSDGGTPESSLTLDLKGDLYGTTYNGGLNVCNGKWPCGVVYELQRAETGWTEIVLHSFDYKDGGDPIGGLVMDSSGNLYGTTPYGGQPHIDPFEPTGTIFVLQPTESGWSFHVLYRFPVGDGGSFANLALDANGSLYGTTNAGGANNFGSVFELQRPMEGESPWTFSTLHSFTGLDDGGGPQAGVVLDGAGNLYGTAGGGGTGQVCFPQGDCGLVFELTPSGGDWTESVLYDFQGGDDGAFPNTTPLLDPWGNLYGTTAYGGDPNCIPFPEYSGCGTVYRISRRATAAQP